MKERFSVRARLKSFKHALNGLLILVKEEHNARIHFFAGILVVASGFFFHVSLVEWAMIVFAIGLVIVTETINSSIEALSDFVTTKKNKQIKKAKDLAAFAVLFSAVVAVVIGLIIFLPKIFAF